MYRHSEWARACLCFEYHWIMTALCKKNTDQLWNEWLTRYVQLMQHFHTSGVKNKTQQSLLYGSFGDRNLIFLMMIALQSKMCFQQDVFYMTQWLKYLFLFCFYPLIGTRGINASIHVHVLFRGKKKSIYNIFIHIFIYY